MRQNVSVVSILAIAIAAIGCVSDSSVSPALTEFSAGVAANGGPHTAPPQGFVGNGNFVAPLSGDEEVPPVMTDARGAAKFKLSSDGMSLSYTLLVANISNVTQSHIHLAPKGSNGGVVAFLYPGPVTGPKNGILAQGTITAANLVGALSGKPLSDLIDKMKAGTAYVNVHTTSHPGGEIRGQIDVPQALN